MFIKNMGRAQLFSRLRKRGSNSTLTQSEMDAQRRPRLAASINLNIVNARDNIDRRPELYGNDKSQLLSNLKQLETKIRNSRKYFV